MAIDVKQAMSFPELETASLEPPLPPNKTTQKARHMVRADSEMTLQIKWLKLGSAPCEEPHAVMLPQEEGNPSFQTCLLLSLALSRQILSEGSCLALLRHNAHPVEVSRQTSGQTWCISFQQLFGPNCDMTKAMLRFRRRCFSSSPALQLFVTSLSPRSNPLVFLSVSLFKISRRCMHS